MRKINLDVLKSKLNSVGASNPIFIPLKDSIEIKFKEGLLNFKIENNSFQILSLNI